MFFGRPVRQYQQYQPYRPYYPYQQRPYQPYQPQAYRPQPQPYRNYQPNGPIQGSQTPTRPDFLSNFKTDEGKYDFNKISGTAQQVMSAYNQVSPLIAKFIRR